MPNPNFSDLTPANLAAYLDSGAPLADVIDMIDMLTEYKAEIDNNITEWYDLIPSPEGGTITDWGSEGRRQDLRTIVTFLYKRGYVLRLPSLDPNGDQCQWEVIKGMKRAILTWNSETQTFSVTGDRPQYQGGAIVTIPDCLKWAH